MLLAEATGHTLTEILELDLHIYGLWMEAREYLIKKREAAAKK